MKKDRAKQVAHFFLITLIVINYAHGFLPEFKNPEKSNLSFSENSGIFDNEYYLAIPNKTYLILISPGMFIGKILRYIIYDQETKPWPRFPIKKREGEKEEMIVQNPGKSYQGFYIYSNKNLQASPIIYTKRYKTKLQVMRKPL